MQMLGSGWGKCEKQEQNASQAAREINPEFQLEKEELVKIRQQKGVK